MDDQQHYAPPTPEQATATARLIDDMMARDLSPLMQIMPPPPP